MYMHMMADITSARLKEPQLAPYVQEYHDLWKGTATDPIARQPHLSSLFPQCERNGVDQGVHNVLLHNQWIPSMTLYRQMNSPVANMQAGIATVRNEYQTGTGQEYMIVYNPAGKMSAVVHQYDRNKRLQEHLYQRVRTCALCSVTVSQLSM